MTKNLNMLQASMIILTSGGLWNHVILIPVLLDVAGRDAWFAIALSLVPNLLWVSLLYWIVKRSQQQPLFSWLKHTAGNGYSFALRIVFIAFLLVTCSITVKDTVDWAVASYLPETPPVALALLLVSLCYFAARSGIMSIAVMSGILLPLIALLGYFVMGANFPNKDYTRLLPVMENGMEQLLRGIVYACSSFEELIFIVLLQHHVGSRIKWWQLALLGFLMMGLTLGPTTGSIAEFGAVEGAKQRYPAFEQWKLVIIHRFIERVDFLSIYQWFAGAFIRLSTIMYLLGELSGLKGKTHKSIFLMLLSLGFVLMMLVPWSDIVFYDWLKYKYLPGAQIGLLALLICLWIAAMKGKKGAPVNDNLG
ncbi:GerAB/ArcD/ProY family transporter [Paenibacillus rigui]|uniref:Spore gernimation protein n=1 Tax=Paenibacillus rigui TaxID=554312 RepID=A0A229UUG0_9BACL|nr:endospore germination permease [Paenibacillus rigui]OXM86891.1 spore gernimation protein [Paenibacillus rigui]